VAKALASGWLGSGPRVATFEERFASYIGARHAVAVSSGTAALHLALLVLELDPEDEVIIPATTFVATANAVHHAGAKIVLADVDPHTLTLAPEAVARVLTARTRVVVPMHYGGHPCDLKGLSAVLKDADIAVIEDAAHAVGARHRDRRVGAGANPTCFSFNAVKNLTTGQGGAITTSVAAVADRLRRLRNHGIDRDTWGRVRECAPYDWAYDVLEPGLNYAMSDLAGALGLAQLERLEAMNARRQRLVCRYERAFRNCSWLELPVIAPWAQSAYHNYVVRLDDRDALARYLGERGIATSVHYRPLHHHTAFASLRAEVPIAEREWRRLLLLPVFPDLAFDEQDAVITAVLEFGGERGHT